MNGNVTYTTHKRCTQKYNKPNKGVQQQQKYNIRKKLGGINSNNELKKMKQQ